MIPWLLCCQAQRDIALQQLSEAYLQLKRWAELLELTIHRLGPNLENEGFKSSLLSQTREKSITFSKLQKSNVKTKDWTVICKQTKIGTHCEIDMDT